jgi:hypothetical protein
MLQSLGLDGGGGGKNAGTAERKLRRERGSERNEDAGSRKGEIKIKEKGKRNK